MKNTDILQQSSEGPSVWSGAREQGVWEENEKPGFFLSGEKKGSVGNLAAIFNYVMEDHGEDGASLFWEMNRDATRGKRHKLHYTIFTWKTRKLFSTARVVQHWNSLPWEAIGPPSSEEEQLFRVVQNLTGFE